MEASASQQSEAHTYDGSGDDVVKWQMHFHTILYTSIMVIIIGHLLIASFFRRHSLARLLASTTNINDVTNPSIINNDITDVGGKGRAMAFASSALLAHRRSNSNGRTRRDGSGNNGSGGLACNDRRVMLVIAHPDDEAMFFVPTISTLHTLPNVHLYILCLSKGQDHAWMDGWLLADIRSLTHLSLVYQ
jgi:hypothetical protein